MKDENNDNIVDLRDYRRTKDEQGAAIVGLSAYGGIIRLHTFRDITELTPEAARGIILRLQTLLDNALDDSDG